MCLKYCWPKKLRQCLKYCRPKGIVHDGNLCTISYDTGENKNVFQPEKK